jgi:phosphoglycerate dehydrogenase-like enzyme
VTDTPLVTIYDPLSWDYGWSYEVESDYLASHGVELRVPENPMQRDGLVGTADVVISSSLVRIDEAVIASLSKCVGILCYSAGMDAVDIEAARRSGIAVANVQANTVEVADHAVALLLSLWRRIPQMSDAARSGRWDLRDYPEVWAIPRLAGKVAGIIGAGRIGRAIAARMRGFDVTTIATYNTPPKAEPSGLPHVPLEELLASADIIFLSAPLNPQSMRMIDSRNLSRVKQGSVLVNIARGGLVDEAALLEALQSGRLAGAALDVRSPEPPGQPDTLASHPKVLQTPHMAGISSQSLIDLHVKAAEGVLDLLIDAQRLPHVVRGKDD